MSEEELEQFEKSLQSFLQHANVEELEGAVDAHYTLTEEFIPNFHD